MVRSAPAVPPAVALTDGVISLRVRRVGDVPAIVAAGEDRETLRWLEDEPHPGESPADNVRRVEQVWASGAAAPLMVVDARSDAALGSVNLQFRDDEVATVAYNVFPAARGRGVAPRAVRLVAAWAFAELGLRRLLLEADELNTASVRVADKCGFDLVERRTESTPAGDRTMVVHALSSP